MSDGKTIPLKYEVDKGVNKASTISIKCIGVDDKENKEECVTIERANNFVIKAKLQEQIDLQKLKDQRHRQQLKKNE